MMGTGEKNERMTSKEGGGRRGLRGRGGGGGGGAGRRNAYKNVSEESNGAHRAMLLVCCFGSLSLSFRVFCLRIQR